MCYRDHFLTVPWVGLQSVIVAFPGHIHAWILMGGGGTGGLDPPPSEKSQKYRVS